MYKNHAPASSLALSLMLVLSLAACKNESGAGIAEAQAAEAPKPAEAGAVSTEEFSTLLEQARPGLEVVGSEATAAKNIIRVDINGSRSLYRVEGTNYFFVGELYRVDAEDGLVNVTEEEKVGVRKELLAKMSVDDMIVFAPEGEVKKHITVYTDVDCGYCQKLHREVPELNAMGIEVRYVAFPRAGVGSPSYQKIASAWCNENPQEALTKVKNREQIATNVCEGNPVEQQYNLGQQMGVTGTPTILFDDGNSIPGYMPAKDLAARLGI